MKPSSYQWGVDMNFRNVIAWLALRSMQNKLINSENKVSTRRFHILWPDEYWDDARGLVNALPWYKPFNAFLHCWTGSDAGLMHDHPRWSISIVLKGALLEQTPKKDKWLTPGSVVFRRSSYVHRLIVPDRHKGKTWTLFIVGRRVYRQHYYHDTGGTSHRYEDNP